MDTEKGVQLNNNKGADKDDLNKKNPNSRLIKVLAVISVVAICAVIGLAIAYVIKDKEDSPEVVPEVCDTAECAKAAHRVLSSIDTSVDPCDNFYQYACGQWKKTNIIPDDKPGQDVSGILADQVIITNKYLLEDPNIFQNVAAIQKAKDLYASCVDLERIEHLDASVVNHVLDDLGGWPVLGSSTGRGWNEANFDMVQFLTKLRGYGQRPLMNMFASVDMKDPASNKILYLDQPSHGLPGQLYYLQDSLQRMRDAYLTYAKSTAVLFGADPALAESDMQNMLAMEIEIANISMRAEDRRNSEALYNKMELKQLSVNFTEAKGSDHFQFSWESYVTEIMKQANVSINGSEPIVVRAVPYFEKLISVLLKYEKRTIANYGIWRLLKGVMRTMPSRFREKQLNYWSVVYGVTTEYPRWKTCESYVTSSFPMAVGHMFVRETFDESAKSAALEMIGNIRSAFKELMEEVQWMDEATKVLAQDKEQAIKSWIGYPDEILDEAKLNEMYENDTVAKDTFFNNMINIYKVSSFKYLNNLRERFDKNIWTTAPSTMNAYYNPVVNSIMFPAGILQPPFYSEGQPRSMNYGGIGVIIGHEITHGFDDRGRQYDKNGNLRHWWHGTIIQKFKEEAQCIIDQYAKYTYREANLTVNGFTCQGENIADNGGLKQSFRAYRRWVDRQGHEEASLPGTNLTHNQLFFINFAQLWCNNIRPATAVNIIKTSAHAPGEFRVIGTLQNSPEFSTAFNCRNDQYMNAKKKCSVW